MSRLTGSEAQGLMEAYNAVYAPQELTEEQVWEEVENWVNSLVEEGYDLSEYTWEEMYESYLSEMGQRMTTGQTTAPKASPIVQSKPIDRIAGGGMGGMRGSGRDRNPTQTSSSPGALRVNSTATPATQPPRQQPPAPAPADVKPAPTAPAAKPAPTAPAAKPAPTAPAAKPAGSAMDQWRAANPKLAAAADEKARIRGTAQTDNPLMKDMKSKMSMTPSVQSPTLAKDLGSGGGNQSLINNPNASKAAPPKPDPTASTPPKKPVVAHYDLFDVIKGHLLDEGYADTEESALAIMANMSGQWKQSILEG